MMKKNSLLKSTAIVTVALLCTRLLGLVRESVLASAYGASAVSDAFVTAFTLPNTILAFIGTSLGTVYIPLYHENKDNSSRFTSNIINLAIILGLCLTILFVCCPGVLVRLFASGYDPETFDLAVTFTRIMMLSTVPILLFNVLKAYLQIQNAFFLATALDAFINIFVIAGIYTSKETGLYQVMAYATVVGNFACFIGLVGSCRKHGLKYEPYINLKDSSIKRLLYLIIPAFIGTAVAELNTIIDRNFASTLATGTVSAMNYAGKINGILYTFMSTAIVTVLYPELVKLASENKTVEVKNYINKCILILGYVILPISAIFIIFAEPIVSVLFQRGSFTTEDTVMTAQCIRMYAISYLAVNINPILNRAFYAYNDTKTPTMNSALAVVLNILLNFALIGRFKHQGLAFTTSIAAIFTTILLLVQLSRKLNGLNLKYMVSDLIKMALSCLLMSVILIIIYKLTSALYTTNIMKFLMVVLTSAVGGLLYFACTSILKTTIIEDFKTVIKSRIRSK